MKLTITYSYGRRIKIWECCGNVWQLIIIDKFPNRKNWSPKCDGCGKSGRINL